MVKELIMEQLPTGFCHASTIIRLKTGGLLCCWFGGSYEGQADVAIYCSRNEGQGWTKPQKLVDSEEANWNPVLFYNQEGTLLLFCKAGNKIASWKTLVLRSSDHGKTWSEASELVAGDESGGRGPVRNKPLLTKAGLLLAGGSTEQGIWQAFVDYSSDGGSSWTKSNSIGIKDLTYQEGEKTADSTIAVSEQSFYGRGVIQPSLWESSAGTHMLLRSSEGFVYTSSSCDGGKTWTEAYKTNLPNNNSGLDLCGPLRGRLYLVCNPVAANWGLRSPLSLLQSADNGCTWTKVLDLETEPSEFSYPAIIEDNGGLCLTYTWKRQNIACVRLSQEELDALLF